MVDQKIAVLGAAGFIGSALCTMLEQHGYQVIPVIRSADKGKGEKRVCDITDPESVSHSLHDADAVIHLAGESKTLRCQEDFDRCHRLNVEGTKNVIKASKNKRLIFASSAYVYGNPQGDGICHEETPLLGRMPYAITKIMAELLCKNYSINYNQDIIIARFFTIFGEHMNRENVIPKIIEQALEKSISVQRMSVIRDYLYVTDAAEAIIAILEKGKSQEIYNVGSGTGTSLSDIVRYVLDELGTMPVEDRNIQSVEPLVRVADTKKIAAIGWRQKIALREGLSKVISFYKKNKTP